VCPLKLCVGRGENGLAFDWIVRSLADVVDVDREIDEALLHAEGLVHLRESPVRFISQNAHECIIQWAGAAYYYARRNNVFSATMGKAVPAVLPTLLRNFSDGDAVEAALMILGWLDQAAPQGADELATLLTRAVGEVPLRRQIRAVIRLGLAARPRPTAGRTMAEWAQSALTDADVLQPHEILHLRCVLFTSCETIDQSLLEDVISACRDAEAVRCGSVDNPYAASVRARLFPIVQPAVRRLAVEGRVDDAIRVLAAWRGIAAAPVTGATLLLALGEDTLSIACQGSPVDAHQANDPSRLSVLVDSTNAALGIQVIRDDVPGFVINRAERLGVPDPSAAEAFERAAEAWLMPERFERRSGAIVELGIGRIPIQALLAKSVGWAPPISVSLREPLPHTPARRAVLWRTDLMYAAEEAQAVCAALEAGGVAVQIVDGDPKGVRDFALIYEDPDVDVIWFSGHAEFDQFRPSQAHLNLGAARLTLAALDELRRPRRSSQRLIVLNTCDGAAAAIHSGMAEVGLSVALAGPEQAVVSHQWPAAALAAAAFGALLAMGVGQGRGFMEAYVDAVQWMRRGAFDVAARLCGVSASLALIDRLKRSTQQWSVIDWGSGALFQ
jgi:hypothetical protein